MTTHKTLTDARQAAKGNPEIRHIIEIDHATEGRVYIGAKCSLDMLSKALKSQSMPELKRLIADYDPLTDAEIAAQREKYLREDTKCERCRKHIDGNTAYHQYERYQGMRVIAYYCEDCHRLLTQVGIGEQTELQNRGSVCEGYEPYTKSDN